MLYNSNSFRKKNENYKQQEKRERSRHSVDCVQSTETVSHERCLPASIHGSTDVRQQEQALMQLGDWTVVMG